MNRLSALSFLPPLLALGAALSAGCSAKIDVVMSAGGAATASFETAGNEAVLRGLAKKAASFAGADAPSPTASLLDEAKVRESFASRKDLSLKSFKKTAEASAQGVISIPRIAAMGAASPAPGAKAGSAGPDFFTWKKAGSTATLSFHLDRANAARLPDLLPGMNRDLLDLLAPPAIYGDDIGKDEYRMNLQPFLGKANLPALDASGFEIRITPPGTPPAKITASSGGTVSGNSFVVKLNLLDILVLDKAIDFSVSWQE